MELTTQTGPLIAPIETDRLSYYKTYHQFTAYAEVHNLKQYESCCQWAAAHGKQVYILGRGSNTVFFKRQIDKLIVKNRLPRKITEISEHRIEVSSSTPTLAVLNHCLARKLDSFYYLASVPATVGGALAMNAGRGAHHQKTIYDFVDQITYYEAGNIITKPVAELTRSYRTTEFTGLHSRLILSAVMTFPPADIRGNPIQERREWSQHHQDAGYPTCGSVFKEADFRILNRLKGLRIRQAWYSPKTLNWINNGGKTHHSIQALIAVTRLLHFMLGRKTKLEVVTVA